MVALARTAYQDRASLELGDRQFARAQLDENLARQCLRLGQDLVNHAP